MAEQRVNILVYRPDGTLIAQYLLGDGEHLIGREINCPVYLDSEYISSNHAKLYLSHDGIQIEDFNSTSGTYLDGVTVRGKLRIKPGQVLQVGDLTVHLQPESEGQIGPGSRLGDGRYTLIRMLGKGGMGEVWLAKDEQLDDEVALKRLPHEVGADAMALADMRREVQKSRALSHPNIVRIHDLVQQAGEDPLISLEYVDGTDLTAIAATKTNGVFNWSDIKDWVLQLATALEYAHEEKIVHRDLKPGNIMISRKGRLKLADFGIAATVADATRRSSMEGFISGTTLYMSPQQMEGKPPKVTDDVYALGATIYELLTSRPPFYTGNVEHQVLNVTPTPPSQRLSEFGFTGEIPPYIQELVMACLAKEPEGRPQTMGAIRQWIQTEGKATDVIPKHTTKTIKIAAPVAEVADPQAEIVPVGNKAKGGLPTPVIYVVGVVFIFICFFVGKNCSDSKNLLGDGERLIGRDINGSVAALPESLKEGLVAYYPFNGNAKDESGNGNDGEINGATLDTDRNGESNSAYQFDGKSWIDIGNIIQNYGNCTFSAWVKIDIKNENYFPENIDLHEKVILSKPRVGNGTGFNLGLNLKPERNTIVCTIISNEHSRAGSSARLGVLTPEYISKWHHVLGSTDGKIVKLYVDGKDAGSSTGSFGSGFNGNTISDKPLFIGKEFREPLPAASTPRFFEGSIDDVRIYNRALSEAEVKALFDYESYRKLSPEAISRFRTRAHLPN